LVILPFPSAGVSDLPVTGIVIGTHERATVWVEHVVTGPVIFAALRPIRRINDRAQVIFPEISAGMIPHDRVPEIYPSLEPRKFLVIEIPILDKAEPP
jgi:hypothetical protein